MQEKLGNIFIQILDVLKMYTLWRQIGKAFQKTCIAYKLCTKKWVIWKSFPNREGNGNPLQYSCLENLTDQGTWRATVHGVANIRHDSVTKPPPTTQTVVLKFSGRYFWRVYRINSTLFTRMKYKRDKIKVNTIDNARPIQTCVYVCSVVSNSFRLFGLLACQAPLSMESLRQEYWTRCPFPPPRDPPHPGMEPVSPGSPALQVDSLPVEPSGKPIQID